MQGVTADAAVPARSPTSWSRADGTYGVWIALGLLLVTALITAPEVYTTTTLQDVLRRASILGIVTMGQVLVLITAGLDLSVGAMIGMTVVLIAEAARADGPPLPVALAAAAAVAIGVGLVNGLLVARRRVPPFVATCGMLIVLEGLRLAYTDGDDGCGRQGMTPEERDAFLQSGADFLKIATTDEGGWPMISPVWYAWDKESFLVTGKERTSYIRNLRRDPRCGLLVDNPQLPYRRWARQSSCRTGSTGRRPPGT